MTTGPDPREAVARALEQTLDPRATSVFISLATDRATREAEESHTRQVAGRGLGPLDGIPIAVKDVFDVAATVTTAGSLSRANDPPAVEDSAVVKALAASGAVSIGKTNLSEFAFSGLGINTHFGTPANPGSQEQPLVPGGSSSGSAVAVALGIVPIAIGTDTSGSVRIPATFCGLVGYKASEHRYDHSGMFPLSPTLDSVGIIATSMHDIVVTDSALAPAHSGRRAGSVSPVLVVPTGELVNKCAPVIRKQFAEFVDAASDRGLRIEERNFPALSRAQQLMDEHPTIVESEAYQQHGHLLRSSEAGQVGDGIMRRLAEFARQPRNVGPVYAAMHLLRRQMHAELGRGFLICPAVRHLTPALAPLLADDHEYDQMNRRTLRTTMLLSYLGMPGVTLPIGTPASGNIGLLISASFRDDLRLLDAAGKIESLRDAAVVSSGASCAER